MWTFLARRLVYPLHERLVGRPTFRTLGELERSQWQAPTELRGLQDRKLSDLLVHASRECPFYHRRFQDAGLIPGVEDPRLALAKLPPLDKHEIRGAIKDMLWHRSPGGLSPSSTGGSTGEPLHFYLDRRRQACDQAARMRSYRWYGVRPGDRELYLWGSPIEHRRDRLRRFRDELLNHRLLDAFNMSPARLDRYMDEWDAFRPNCLFGYPSSISCLAGHATGRGRRLDRASLRAVFVTGEVCMPQDRQRIEEYFQVPVADGYGGRDSGFIAHQCPAGRMHITAESLIVEILEEGRAVGIGQSGEIVITHLDNYGMPLIRYRTGDVGRLLPGRCACGRGLPLLDVLQGRTTDFLHLPDGNSRHALSIIYPLRETPGIHQFRVIQHEDFSVVVEVVADPSAARITPETVARRVRPVIGDAVGLDLRFVDEITPAASGKHRYVVSRAQPARSKYAEAGGVHV